ncbi:MAG TPA: hypothetical protein VGM20_08895 [Gemmatimonadales bacterium]|jgi:outer membrane lipoprotein SlyB
MKWILTIAAIVTLATPAHSQGPTRLGLQARNQSTSIRTTRIKVDSVASSHWAQGMVIGGLIGAALGALLNHLGSGISDVSHSSSALILGSAALGAIIGGLIGSGSHSKS